ncbi:hypothetical protein HNQ50_001537 [Silvimonas terrae]|uniref:Glycosyltransferase involved in cell wall biosynthesis n=1 Tax=Silvimonas terrae TaxID=300266 RepID=A0A840RE01_9NEIS|nr:glycosyltransferase family 4 protein [Silvimonas terrae]MBB5190814.1 hypothetical protein [Silvimonas terrae]
MTEHPHRNAAPLAVLVCEALPRSGENGPGSYNMTILRAIAALGYRLHLVVTGLNVAGTVVAPEVPCTVSYLHARQVGRWLLPLSVGAAARWVKNRLGLKGRKTATDKVAWIGRFLSEPELARIPTGLPAEPVAVLLVDTIFRADAVRAIPQARTKVLIAHDVFHLRCASFRANGFMPRPAIVPEQEAARARLFDAIIAINPHDATELAALAPAARVSTVLPVVANAGRVPGPQAGHERQPHRIFYLGSRAYHNVDGLRWFLEHVWPVVRANVPDAHLDVAGAVCGEFAGAGPGVTLHGRVDDLSSVTRYCSFAVNPVLMGSGIKIKMVDYFCVGLGCITTANGAAGFPEQPAPPFDVAEGKADFASAVVRTMQQPDHAALLRERTIAYTPHFSAEAAVARLRELLLSGGGVALAAAGSAPADALVQPSI